MPKRIARIAGQLGEDMANAVQFVFELREKILRLIEWARNNDSPLNSTRAIERVIRLNHATLFSNMEKYRMSPANQLALAKAYGFSVEWSEWRDPNEIRHDVRSDRRDTAEAFIAKFVAEKSNGARLTIAAGPTWKHIDRRFADFTLAVSATYKPEASANAIPLTVGLSFDRRGWAVLLDEAESILTIGLKQVDLQLFYERASARIDVFPLPHSNGTDANFCGDVEGLSPWWLINVAAGDLSWLAGKRLSNDGQDCVCHDFHAGDSIRAVMTARVNDCFVRAEGEVFEDLSPAKSLLIRHLAKLSVLNSAEAVLCEQILTVMNKS
jgi:hypothetical protein